jgi:bifunctional non-homologous end joining protein LigD
MRLKFVPPSMPTLVEKPPEGDGWIHEVKFDGYRSQIVSDAEGVRIFTRRGLDWTSKYRDLAKAAGWLDAETAIIDGEIIVLNDAGLSDFAGLRKAITRRQHDLYFFAFDLLHLNGHDLRDMALEDRREILAEMIPEGGRIQFSQALPGDAKLIFRLVDQAGLEGMVSKRRDSKYRSGTSTNWLKVTRDST